MKLAAIYNVFDGEEHLEASIHQIKPFVDVVIAVVQRWSNWGESYTGGVEKCDELKARNLITHLIEYTPVITGSTGAAMSCEKAKRNMGLDLARDLGCTHFLSLDCDEYYDSAQFMEAIEAAKIHRSTVAQIKTYFKTPTLAFSKLDSTYVPFISQILPSTRLGVKRVPMNRWKVDPTRIVNADQVWEIPASLCIMHHMSWVRNDIERKVRNSTARDNLKRGNLLEVYKTAKAGTHIGEIWNDTLEEVPNLFNI